MYHAKLFHDTHHPCLNQQLRISVGIVSDGYSGRDPYQHLLLGGVCYRLSVRGKAHI